jgi:indole-3-glycerol phosphate synthase
MTDFLDKLILDADSRLRNGYYDTEARVEHKHLSLGQAIKQASHNAIIAEIKPKSPARGTLRVGLDPKDIAMQLARGGAVALSVLTEPDNFGGRLDNLVRIRPYVSIPLLMKDIVIDAKQIIAAEESGADCILLILSALSRKGIQPAELIREAHRSRMEVLLEVHNAEELDHASTTDADIIGINNRNMTTLEIDLNTTTRLIESAAAKQIRNKALISESGLETMEDIRRLKRPRINGFLIGSSIMLATDPERKVREFVHA